LREIRMDEVSPKSSIQVQTWNFGRSWKLEARDKTLKSIETKKRVREVD